MTTYTAILNTEVDPNSPITADLMTKMRDNPIAISESVSSAPVNQSGWHPYDSTLNGTNSGIIYSFAVSGAVATIETPTLADNYEYMFLIDGLSTAFTGNITLEFYRETSAAYAAASVLFTSTSTTQSYFGRIETYAPRKTLRGHMAIGNVSQTSANATGTYTQLNILVNHTTAQKIGKFRFAHTGGNFNGGTVYMFRRRLY